MPNKLRDYFDQRVPIQPLQGQPPSVGWGGAWNRLSKALFLTLPSQLDRAKVNRNKFGKAVQ